MAGNKPECDSCIIQGYSPELCKMHLKHMERPTTGKTPAIDPETAKHVGYTAAIGACIGVAGTIAGMAVVPALGMKALLGHLAAVKAAAAGGAFGAGANVAVNAKKKS